MGVSYCSEELLVRKDCSGHWGSIQNAAIIITIR